uniref:PDZ domain-containing protein n=1 Tax=Noctiluca scintillans TaxID=2966 RepID=A0A7S1APA0_NOCSC
MGQQCCCRDDNRDLYGPPVDVSGVPSIPKIDRTPVATKESTGIREVVLEFSLPDDMTRTVSMAQRPTGVRYRKTMPVTVGEVQEGSHGHDLGIQEGWKLVTIDGQTTADMTADEVKAILRLKVSVLPQVRD